LKNLFQRTVSGIFYLAIVIGALFSGRYAFGALFLVTTLLALYEFHNLTGLCELNTISVTGLFAAALIFITGFVTASGITRFESASVIIVIPVILMITGIFAKSKQVTNELQKVMMGLLYVAVPLSLMNYLVFPQANHSIYTHRILLGILILIWINDTGAYVTGMLLGKHKMAPRISPKKSWEGLAGGTLFTLVPSYWMNQIMGILTITDWIALAILVCIFGVLGDLAESMMKRNANIKDSGNLIPGHGGILDRFDSILFVVPVAVVYLALFYNA
jgi:phosphatidate cytidylyltransferase